MRNLIAILEEKQSLAYQDWERTGREIYLGRYTAFAEAEQALVDELNRKEAEEAKVKIN